MDKTITVGFVGDKNVGKTCIILKYGTQCIPNVYNVTYLDQYTFRVDVRKKPLNVIVWDTAGFGFDWWLRGLSYTNPDFFIVCFSLTDKKSFENVKNIWIAAIQGQFSGTPYILVGTKRDLIEDRVISYDQGKLLADEINAEEYIECSCEINGDVTVVMNSVIINAMMYKDIPTCYYKCVIQ